jgi:hypothetical protein
MQQFWTQTRPLKYNQNMESHVQLKEKETIENLLHVVEEK